MTVCAHEPRQTRTFGNFAAIETLTSATVASGVTSIVRGNPRAKEGGFDAESIVSETIAVVDSSLLCWNQIGTRQKENQVSKCLVAYTCVNTLRKQVQNTMSHDTRKK